MTRCQNDGKDETYDINSSYSYVKSGTYSRIEYMTTDEGFNDYPIIYHSNHSPIVIHKDTTFTIYSRVSTNTNITLDIKKPDGSIAKTTIVYIYDANGNLYATYESGEDGKLLLGSIPDIPFIVKAGGTPLSNPVTNSDTAFNLMTNSTYEIVTI